MAVLPAAQGRGVGARLLALAEEHACGLGLGEVRLYTNEAMTENIAYYTRHGYAETRRYEQDGFRRVFFARPSRDQSAQRRSAVSRSMCDSFSGLRTEYSPVIRPSSMRSATTESTSPSSRRMSAG